jgi:hypothetical protein
MGIYSRLITSKDNQELNHQNHRACNSIGEIESPAVQSRVLASTL